nr:serpin family protein [Candidatus Sigynarchaeota archaeon]
NAIYFLGTWSKPFKKSDTRVKPFYPLSGQQASVSLMHAIIPCKYAEDAAVQYIELPYQGETMVMGIILPRRRDGLPEIEQKLSIDDFNHLSRFSMRQPVDIFLPRFKLDSTFDLEKTLQAMGMMLPFQPLVADFSGITGPPGVVISKLIHKAFVDVNEEGTEAAAATAILVLPSGAPGKPQPPPEFKADHPFIFIIKDTSTNAILFIGHVALPPPATASVTQVPFLPRGPPPPRR